ncbi:non-hydrolyzing UDP-N-acetylglucosamine 2-epimerase [Salisediminibacterium halotolerans]|uniref:non-hydrolyzing UDP-N-acetylglucosamine 2-epimerase n=1 Tax=Salisediminibacterium halotolerans TaxID=517425 RepID=UPI000EAC9C0F|nr:UDP-N-acetylglucosamine 2-epimerase (non-hydrolyzing) [Salisediminibacterium halotolerans]RLJ75700.1 UDP-N-acetylglucosamine 2-epimerase (non-hydrolysing) [Actinophytocola xinjiangensis]RPE89554.1 UDP-N-acetylglucosamine 2-epimerase (non-hydrolysing) [Salisediminibacterium halotolerans]TWG36313.1 UDP-N-acetylglucosamine 2-epimerase (non-hydrolysing) [Salisediminibacterium halotolerans]GEL07239.1 UDP-N-acetyl glucosamine 2-epimerase [Salisediminibacterium halotolerans]
MKKLKVMTVVGTRPEIIRLSAVINKLDQSKAIEHTLVHTGQNYDYELNQVFFDDFHLRKPDYFLNSALGSPAETIGNILIKIDPILEQVLPEAFLILGDTNSCLCSIAAKRRKIPIFHMEAGNRCFDQRVPEESNRKIVDHTADVNLTYSDIAREYLLREGLPADRIIKTGSPMYEVLASRKADIQRSEVLKKLDLAEGKYFVVSAHREENINSDTNFTNLVHSLNTIAEKYNLPVIISTHPRTLKMFNEKNIEFNPLIKTMKPLGFNDYVKLQLEAKAVLSDSGTISEESSILGFKAVNIRQAHERPEAMEEASVMMAGLEKERILQALEVLETQEEDTLELVNDYSMPNVSDKVLRILLSYTDYVNRVVWGKSL